MNITTWTQEHFRKPSSVNRHHCIHKCKLRLYYTKRTTNINNIQKHHKFLWTRAHLRLNDTKWKSFKEAKEKKEHPDCYQLKHPQLWWSGVVLVLMIWETWPPVKEPLILVHTGFEATNAGIQTRKDIIWMDVPVKQNV